jgi:hypothetical protein
VLRGLVALVVLVALSPALYYYGTTWLRGAVEVSVEGVYPIGNKGTLEAKLSHPDGTVHRVLNRDQTILFWKIDSEGVDNELSTAFKRREPVSVWVSGAYMPFFGNKTLFNHMNVLAVDPWLPPGVLPAATYLVALLLLGLWLRRLVRGLLAGAKRLTHRESGEQGGAA